MFMDSCILMGSKKDSYSSNSNVIDKLLQKAECWIACWGN